MNCSRPSYAFYSSGGVVSLVHIFVHKLIHHIQIKLCISVSTAVLIVLLKAVRMLETISHIQAGESFSGEESMLEPFNWLATSQFPNKPCLAGQQGLYCLNNAFQKWI